MGHNGQDLGDGLSGRVDLGDLGSGSTSDLLNSERRELGLELVELLEQSSLAPVQVRRERGKSISISFFCTIILRVNTDVQSFSPAQPKLSPLSLSHSRSLLSSIQPSPGADRHRSTKPLST